MKLAINISQSCIVLIFSSIWHMPGLLNNSGILVQNRWRGSCVSEIKELLKQIEESRVILINTQKGRAYTDPIVIAASQELDVVLYEYHVKLMKKADMD